MCGTKTLQMKFMNSLFSGGVYRAVGSVILTDDQNNDVQLMGNVSKSLFWPGIFIYFMCNAISDVLLIQLVYQMMVHL